MTMPAADAPNDDALDAREMELSEQVDEVQALISAVERFSLDEEFASELWLAIDALEDIERELSDQHAEVCEELRRARRKAEAEEAEPAEAAEA